MKVLECSLLEQSNFLITKIVLSIDSNKLSSNANDREIDRDMVLFQVTSFSVVIKS
jgi:hypothetical protein